MKFRRQKHIWLLGMLLLIFSSVNCADSSKPVQANTGEQESTVSFPDSPLTGLARLQDYEWARSTSYDEGGQNVDYREIQPWETMVLDTLEGPGYITRIWMALNSDAEHYLRKLVLKAYWDDSDQPAFEVPIGDFFGNGFAKYNHYISLAMAVKYYWGLNCYLPMPFEKSARFELVNESNEKVKAVFHHIDYVKLDEIADDMGYLYAWWNRETPVLDALYRVLETEGNGQYVGCFLHTQTTARGWWGEGDDHVYIDDPREPVSIGTGSEDYFGGAWMFNQVYPDMYSGCSLLEPQGEKHRTSMFRFHLEAPVRFRKYFKLDFEHDRQDDYCSTAFWYQKQPPKAISPLPHVLYRLPRGSQMDLPHAHDFEAMKMQVFSGPEVGSRIQDMTHETLPMNGGKRLILEAKGADAEVRFDSSTVPSGKYLVKVFTGRGPAGAIFNMELAGKDISFNGFAEKQSLCEPVDFGELNIEDPLRFKVTIKGKDTQSSGYDVYLDCLELKPVE